MSGTKSSRRSTREEEPDKSPAERTKKAADAPDSKPRASRSTTAAKPKGAGGRAPKTARTPEPSKAAATGTAKSRTSRQAGTDAVCLIRFPIEVRWRDLDAFNHVNNANFLTYVEEARLAWMQSLEGPWVTETSAPVLAAVQVNFRRPIAWPESLVIELTPGRVGSSSLTLAYRMVSAADATVVYSDGETVMVWVDANTGKAAPLPDAVRAGTDPDHAVT